MKKRKLKYEWVWLTILVIVIFYFVYSYIIVDINIEPMQGKVGPKNSNFYGMELFNDSITFGEMPRGSVVKRDSKISNGYEFPVKIYFFTNGELGKHIYLEPTSVYLDFNETKNVTMYFPMAIPEGHYEGNLIMLTRRTIFGV